MTETSLKKYKEIVCKAHNSLDAGIMAPYLADDFKFDSPYADGGILNKEHYIEMMSQQFAKIASNPHFSLSATIEAENGEEKVVLRYGGPSLANDITVSGGKITKMSQHPLMAFSSAHFYEDFTHIARIAYDTLQSSFSAQNKHKWAWLQNNLPEIRFQDLCIACDNYVLSIMVGLYEEAPDGNGIVVNHDMYVHLLEESEEHHLTPCLFLIDADGKPMHKGCNLLDACMLEPINLDNLTEDNGGIMSEWELHRLGVSYAAEFLEQQGARNIQTCDVLSVAPQVSFELNGTPAFAVVRTVPAGLTDKKIKINQQLLINTQGNPGFFIDVILSSPFGGTGLFDDKAIGRCVMYPIERNGEKTYNIMHNRFTPIDINEAIKDGSAIELSAE